MHASELFRPAIAAIAAAAFAITTLATPASAGTRRNEEVGAAIAIGVGALVVGSILASKSRDRHPDAYNEPSHGPRFDQNRYHHPAPHVNQAPPKRYDPSNSGR